MEEVGIGYGLRFKVIHEKRALIVRKVEGFELEDDSPRVEMVSNVKNDEQLLLTPIVKEESPLKEIEINGEIFKVKLID